MSQAYNTPNTDAGGTKHKAGFDQLIDMIGSIRSHWLGSSAFGTPANGDLWLDNTDTTDYVAKLYENSGWITLDIKSELKANKDFAGYQAVNMRLENIANTPGSAAASVGRVVFNTTDGKLDVDDNGVSGGYQRCVSFLKGTGTLTYDPIAAQDWQKPASNPPTEVEVGSTPTVKGLLFDATNETLTLAFRVPYNWIGDSDIDLSLMCALNAAETNGDDIDWSCNWVSITPASGDSIDQTSTAASALLVDIGTNSAQYDVHECNIVLDHDDANNPIVAGDLVVCEISRTNLTEVAGVLLIDAGIVYYADDI